MSRSSIIFFLVVGAGITSACGSSDSGDEPGLPDGGGGTDAGPDQNGQFEGGTADACPLHCSDDMHRLLDCNGDVRTECADDTACGSTGTCISACDAIKDRKGSIGCDFYVHHPEPNNDGCFAAYIVNTWSSNVVLTGTVAGVPVNVTSHAYIPNGTGASLTYKPLPGGELPPGGVAIVFLHEGTSTGRCPMAPVAAPVGWNDWRRTTGKGTAFKISASAPVAAYDIFPFGGGKSEITSASLLLPTSSWGDNYVAVTPVEGGNNVTSPAITIVADQDGTEVKILPKMPITEGEGVAGTAANTQVTYTLNQGETLHFSQTKSLHGSVIASNNPVGLWAEQACFQLDEGYCDGGHQQIPPVQTLGSEYVGVRYRNRIDDKEESPPWRVMGVVAGTKLTWEPQTPVGAPTQLGIGDAFTFRTNGPFVVHSQDTDHPFYINAYMTGGGDLDPCDPVGDVFCFGGRGDPDFVNVVPASEFMQQYTFFTDPTYPETNLVYVRAKAKDGTFKDVSLDCAGNLTGWQPAGTSGNYEYTRIDLSRHNFEAQGSCDNGRHETHSDGPFSLTVWGWGSDETGDSKSPTYSQYVSYGYPAGASLAAVNTVIVPPVPR